MKIVKVHLNFKTYSIDKIVIFKEGFVIIKKMMRK